ncbi:MAG: TPM domain-containing protein [Thermodesulfobacteriota bacterium]
MRRRPVFLSLLAGLFLLATTTLAWGREVPAFQGYVNDYANLISPGARQQLTELLSAFDQSDSTQVAILTIDSLEGEDLEGFSIRVVDQWKVGQQGKDNGVLLLVAKQERKIRIEVGRGLEGVLTDLLSGRIIDQAIAPAFRAGQIDQGFINGAQAIIAATRGEFKADPNARRRTGDKAPPIVSYLFIALLLVAFLGNVSKKLGAGAGAVLVPLAAYGGMGAAIPLLFLLLLIPAGLLAGIIAPLILNGLASGHGGGFYYGGRGGGFGGGGGGFGGFGGGGFGGGGASGGW